VYARILPARSSQVQVSGWAGEVFGRGILAGLVPETLVAGAGPLRAPTAQWMVGSIATYRPAESISASGTSSPVSGMIHAPTLDTH
jgi:hypothetical protein